MSPESCMANNSKVLAGRRGATAHPSGAERAGLVQRPCLGSKRSRESHHPASCARAGGVVQREARRTVTQQLARARPEPQRRRPRGVEARLYSLLRRLDPQARRSVISGRMSETQRLSLERWIFGERAAAADAATSTTVFPPLLPASGTQIVAAAVGVSRASRAAASSCGIVTVPVRRLARPNAAYPTGPSGRAVGLSGVHGISCRTAAGRRAYSARATAGPFHLSTRWHADFGKVVLFHRGLMAIRDRISAVRRCEDQDRFCQLLVEELESHDLQAARDMGLRFVAVVSAKHWVGKTLATPSFPISDLRAGVLAWRRLSEARSLVYSGRTNMHTSLQHNGPRELAAAWTRLRTVYLDIWESAGHHRDVIDARLSVLEARQRPLRERLFDRWHRLQVPIEVSRSRPNDLNRRIESLLAQWSGREARLARTKDGALGGRR